jgi:hypothetical protein
MIDTSFRPSTPPTFDPVHVLGCSEVEAARLLAGKVVTPGEVEAAAMVHYDWRRHSRDPRSYWVTVTQAAHILHVSPTVVKRMLEDDRLPHVFHMSGVRLMRRHEIEDVASSRRR